MLDVHTASTGDVTKALHPYDHDFNLRFFTTMCARLGIHVPREDAVALMRAMGRFRCAR
jgi:hypothetical protein